MREIKVPKIQTVPPPHTKKKPNKKRAYFIKCQQEVEEIDLSDQELKKLVGKNNCLHFYDSSQKKTLHATLTTELRLRLHLRRQTLHIILQ